jgi:phosphoglycerate dehydrogenase-like enzyme
MQLRGKTLGIVGLGPIGTEMARLGAGLGMRLIGWTRRPSPARAQHGLTLVSLDDLFTTADVVTLHLAYTPESQAVITRALLERMKPEAWFVNTARARIVDNAALVERLRSGRLRGAAFDVYETEPLPADNVFRTLPNVLITPHIGYNTREASANMLRIAIDTVEAFARGERLHVVNGV